jgi:hypothetical protein
VDTKTKRKERAKTSEQKIIVYKELVKWDNPSLKSNIDIADAISRKFNVEVTERDLLIIESPTIQEMEEDYRLIYKHCVT